jgi:hypothetical protein
MKLHSWYEINIQAHSDEEIRFNSILQDAYNSDYFKKGNGKIYKKIENNISYYNFSPGAAFFFSQFLPAFNPIESQKPDDRYNLLYGSDNESAREENTN